MNPGTAADIFGPVLPTANDPGLIR
jgi:hypothetical protein